MTEYAGIHTPEAQLARVPVMPCTPTSDTLNDPDIDPEEAMGRCEYTEGGGRF